MAEENKKKASDFRYNTGETRVPWAAVGEDYNAEDVMAVIRFMMEGEGEAYERAMSDVQKSIFALDKVSAPRKAFPGQSGGQGREEMRRISPYHGFHFCDELYRRF